MESGPVNQKWIVEQSGGGAVEGSVASVFIKRQISQREDSVCSGRACSFRIRPVKNVCSSKAWSLTERPPEGKPQGFPAITPATAVFEFREAFKVQDAFDANIPSAATRAATWLSAFGSIDMIRLGKKRGFESDCESCVTLGGRRAGLSISQAADLLGFHIITTISGVHGGWSEKVKISTKARGRRRTGWDGRTSNDPVTAVSWQNVPLFLHPIRWSLYNDLGQSFCCFWTLY